MKTQIIITIESKKEEDVFAQDTSENDLTHHKTSPYCGQGKFPFKMGVCICGKQVGQIQFAHNSESFTKNYEYIIEDKKWTT